MSKEYFISIFVAISIALILIGVVGGIDYLIKTQGYKEECIKSHVEYTKQLELNQVCDLQYNTSREAYEYCSHIETKSKQVCDKYALVRDANEDGK